MGIIGMLSKIAAIVALILGISIAAGPALAQNLGNPGVLPPNSNAFGKSYAEWSAAWWQWLLSIPEAVNPNLLTGAVDCAEGQAGKVWFLGGAFPGVPGAPVPPIHRSCTIPNGKALFFSPLNVLDGELAPSPVSDCNPGKCNINDLRALAAATVDNQEPQATIDGVSVKNLADQYRVASPVFSAHLPDGAIFSALPPRISEGEHEPLVSDGYWLLLTPLSLGTHHIHFNSSASDPGITYTLTVK
jgi:hypothetical protein